MKQKGFTLIELLVTMGIIAILAGMSIFNFNQSRMRARDVQRKSDLSQLKNALELYKIDNNGQYPSDNTLPNLQNTLHLGKYTTVTFADPSGSSWDSYSYSPSNSNTTYILTACLENKADTTRVLNSTCSAGSGVLYQVNNP